MWSLFTVVACAQAPSAPTLGPEIGQAVAPQTLDLLDATSVELPGDGLLVLEFIRSADW